MADVPPSPDFFGREWLLGDIRKWLEDSDATRALVVAAPPGWGKTALASHLADSLDVDYAHFCKVRDRSTIEPHTFVENLVNALATRVPAFAEAVGAPTSDVKGDVRVGPVTRGGEVTGVRIERLVLNAGTARSAFDTYVLRPIAELARTGRLDRTVTVLVDGLDEVGVLVPRESVIDILREGWGPGARGLPQQLRLLAFTRDVPDVLGAFDARIVRPAGAREDLNDVRAYVAHELGGSGPVDEIASASEGNFLFAHLMVEEIRSGRSPDEVLAAARGLSDYAHDLLTQLARDVDEWQSESGPVLGALAVAGARGLDKEEIADVTGVSPPRLDDALRGLARLINASDGNYRIVHTALGDALLRDPELSPYTPKLRERFRGHPDLSQLIAPLERALRDQVEWVSDTPARRDYLNRKPVAVMVGRRLRRIASRQDGGPADYSGSFLLHLDGAWGTGKSSILNFLREELEAGDPPWMVVEFNAWQQSRLGPAWWSLLAALRQRLVRGLDARRRVRLRLAEASRRARLTGAPYVLTLVVVLAVAAALAVAVGPRDVLSGDPEQIAKGVTAVLTAIATLWAGALVASRFMLWDSVVGARVFERSNQNPMAYLREHFAWLVDEAERPVAFFVDDLDRCDQEYVVELLDGIQTLVRDTGAAEAGGPFFVIAADGGWIRASYQHQHEAMATAVREPGQTLGDLFLDKIFQLTVTVPSLSTTRQASYLKRLLASDSANTSLDENERDRVENRIRDSRTQAEVHAAWRSASADVREEVAPLAVERLTERAVEAETEHELQKFAALLDRNPRRIKRFLNTYTADLVTSGLEDNFLDPDALALWTILRMRWPMLATYLRGHPEAIQYAQHKDATPDDVELAIRAVLHSRDFQALVNCHHGGPLTVDLVERLTRGATGTTDRADDDGDRS